MKLFEDFDPVTSKQWKQQIQFELKGADYNQSLVWESPEGIKVKPFYHFDEQNSPISPPLTRAPFSICQDIFVKDVEKSAHRAKDSIGRGAESIRFTIADKDIDLRQLLDLLPTNNVTIYLNFACLAPELVQLAATIASEKESKIICLIDPVGNLAADGNWFDSPGKDNFAVLNSLATAVNIPTLSINASLYQNAGATAVQQIAYALAHVNEYFNRIPNLAEPITFQISVGSNYFFEIAKIRALRTLFKIVAAEYGHEKECHIIATPTKRNKTIYDYNVNMLRTTTECMSAIIGGADTVANLPYDVLYHKSNEFGERISRNQLLIMKHESYLDKVGNPADGSYYIESLTEQLAEKALALFKDIETNGGFVYQLGDGTIQRKIAESAAREQQLFDDGTEVLLGTNKHPNKNDRMADELELYPFVKSNPRKTLIKPIIEKRLAEASEQERLLQEKQF